METKNAVDIARDIEDAVNVMGSKNSIKSMVGYLTNMHRTLVQSFVGSFIIPFIKTMAKHYTDGWYDGRDEVACKMCKIMFDGLCKEYPYFEKEDLDLPLI